MPWDEKPDTWQIRLTIRLAGRLRLEDVEAMPAEARGGLRASFRVDRPG